MPDMSAHWNWCVRGELQTEENEILLYYKIESIGVCFFNAQMSYQYP